MTPIYTHSSRHERRQSLYSQAHEQITRRDYRYPTLDPLNTETSDKDLYVGPSTYTADIYDSRAAPISKSTREQLPPLSSIFSSTSHQTRSPPTSYSSGHSPVFRPVSPNDPREAGAWNPVDRAFRSSHFQRRVLACRHSHNSRPEIERLEIPPPLKPSQVGARPKSPLHDSRLAPLESSRSCELFSVNTWSPHSPSYGTECFPTFTSSSFRPHPEVRQPAANDRSRTDSRTTFRNGQQSAPESPTYPSSPASTVTNDHLAIEDRLTPKLWSGTQFPPRFVRSAEVPGERMCFSYNDETHCKTAIDKEIVNTHWSITKARKLKKRLPIVGIISGGKNLDRDADHPHCVQSKASGGICKFKIAPRSAYRSPDIPTSGREDSVSCPALSRADSETFKVENCESSRSVSPRHLGQATPDSENHQPKRQRTHDNDFTFIASEALSRLPVHDPAFPEIPCVEAADSGLIDQSGPLQKWQMNPLSTHPVLVSELILVFFKHVPETAYSMFPEEPFKTWTLSVAEKSPEDLMLVYTVLALGTVFSKSEHNAFGTQFAAVARFACDNSRFTIQLVQSRILLALYYFAINNAEDAWNFCGAALRAASGIKLNLEIEKTEDAHLSTFPYGLTRAGFAECRRRTFWSCYLMDRYNGFCSGHLSIVQSDDVFVRLPCDMNSFESQLDTRNPFFDPAIPPIQNINWTMDSMAYLINITTIWGEVMANIYRNFHRPSPSTKPANFATFYNNATLRLRIWKDALPSCYISSPENLARAASGGKLGIFMMMHTVYHTTAMNLNRYIQQYNLTNSQLTHHVKVSKHHAEDLLKVIDTLATFKEMPSSPVVNGDSQATFSSPFVGYAIVSAIDILTAKVTVHSIASRLASFQGSQAILAELAQFWHSSQSQHALIRQRVRNMADLVRSREEVAAPHIVTFARETGDGLFEMTEAMEKRFSQDYDCIYA